MDDYTKLKNNINKYYETNFTYSSDKKQFNLNNLKNFLISVNNQQATKERTEAFLRDIILKERQEIVSANPGGQKEGKESMLGIYNDILQLFAPLFQTVNKQPDQQRDTTDMPDLESEESAEKNRKEKGVGLKILTPNQMLCRLPITLVKFKAGNNSEKLKNEIRQLLYSLYISKKLTKSIYKRLIGII